MVATHSQHTSKDDPIVSCVNVLDPSSLDENETAVSRINPSHSSTSLLLPNRVMMHHPKAGLNPLVDAAGYLFSILGKLKRTKSYRQLSKLQVEFVQEVNLFQETAKHHGYNAEYIIVCRYVICAVIDDIIAHTHWGSQGVWANYSLLAAFNQDIAHQDKFFSIMERAIKDPSHYIDLMELMYISLSMGYKGQYRATEHSQYQLEQIINNLYKHIRAYRGSFSKTLSPTPLKTTKSSVKTVIQNKTSAWFIFFVTACVVMAIFVSLGYLMDVISNEAYKNISQIQNSVSRETIEY